MKSHIGASDEEPVLRMDLGPMATPLKGRRETLVAVHLGDEDLVVCQEERRQEEALALEKAGKNEEAEALVEAPVVAPAIVIPQTTTKVEGISKLRKLWKFRVMDASLVPNDYKVVDEVKLGQVVRATKGTLRIPGVEIYSEDTVSAR